MRRHYKHQRQVELPETCRNGWWKSGGSKGPSPGPARETARAAGVVSREQSACAAFVIMWPSQRSLVHGLNMGLHIFILSRSSPSGRAEFRASQFHRSFEIPTFVRKTHRPSGSPRFHRHYLVMLRRNQGKSGIQDNEAWEHFRIRNLTSKGAY